MFIIYKSFLVILGELQSDFCKNLTEFVHRSLEKEGVIKKNVSQPNHVMGTVLLSIPNMLKLMDKKIIK